MQTLLLVRHGRSAHVHDGHWIDRGLARRFIQAYDAAGIQDTPPRPLVDQASQAAVFAASDLPRAIASIKLLTGDRPHEISPLLRELDFELPAWGPRMPINTWDALYHALWTTRMLVGADHPDLRRARAAADWLEPRCASSGLTVVVTHGGFRRLLSHVLAKRGWRRDRYRRYHNWSVWQHTRD